MEHFFKGTIVELSPVCLLCVLVVSCAKQPDKSAEPVPDKPALAEPPSTVDEPGAETATEADASGKPKTDSGKWAEPIDKAGLPNFFKISDTLYRGAQPAPEGFKALADLGIKTVVNLRLAHSDRDEMEEAGVTGKLGYEHIEMAAWNAEKDEIAAFLKIATDKGRQPVFVHCQHGADRTGTMSAVYRIVVQGWTKEEAIEEMVKGPYGFHEIWEGLPEFIQNLNVEELRKELGLAATP